MKSHKLFNVSLYKDMLRQLRLIGVAFSIICLVISILVPIASYLNRPGPAYYDSYSYTPSAPEAAMVTPVLWVFLYAGGALLVYGAFSFLNKRNASDFYHSMPNTALATWSSAAAAVATWIVGIIVTTVTVTMAAYSLLGLPITWAQYPYLIGYFSIGTLLVAAASMVAVAITGTGVTNLALTGLILFLPRGLALMLTTTIESRTVIVPMEQMGLLNIAYHIPMGVVSGSNPIYFTGAFWYSGVLALVLAALSVVLYRARKSETAEKSAPSRLLQHVFRSAVVLPLIIAPTLMAAASRENIFTYLRHTPQAAILLWGLAIVAYYVYELITTKKIKNLLTITPIFLVLSVVSSLVVWIAVVSISDSQLNRLPAVSSVEGVRPTADPYNTHTYGYQLAGQLFSGDPAIIAEYHAEWERNIRQVKEDTIYDSSFHSVRTEFVTKGGTLVRNLKISDAAFRRIEALFQKNPAYAAAMRALPEDREINDYSVYTPRNGTRSLLQAKALWHMLKSELAAMDDDAYFRYIAETNTGDVPFLSVSGRVNGAYYTTQYPLTATVAGTLAEYIRMVNAQWAESFTTFRALAFAGELSDGGFAELSVLYANIPALAIQGDYFDLSGGKFGDNPGGEEALRGFLALVPESPAGLSIDVHAPYIQVSFRFNANDTYYEGTVFLPLSEEQVDALVARYQNS